MATVCAVCNEFKETPLRRDELGGYICLTCVEKELNRLQKIESNHEEKYKFLKSQVEQSDGAQQSMVCAYLKVNKRCYLWEHTTGEDMCLRCKKAESFILKYNSNLNE